MHKFKFLILISSSILLYGCGGGSSTPSQPVAVIDPNMTVPVQKAMSNIIINGINSTYTIAGWAGSVAQIPLVGAGTLNSGPAISWTINGLPAFKATQIITQNITVNGKQSSGTYTTTQYFKADDYTKLADATSTSFNLYDKYSYPSTVKAGDTGILNSSKTYPSSQNMTDPGVSRSSTSYLVTRDTNHSLLFVLNTDIFGQRCNTINESNVPSYCDPMLPASTVFYTLIQQSKTTYRIDVSGAISLVTIELNLYTGSNAVGQKEVFTF